MFLCFPCLFLCFVVWILCVLFTGPTCDDLMGCFSLIHLVSVFSLHSVSLSVSVGSVSPSLLLFLLIFHYPLLRHRFLKIFFIGAGRGGYLDIQASFSHFVLPCLLSHWSCFFVQYHFHGPCLHLGYFPCAPGPSLLSCLILGFDQVLLVELLSPEGFLWAAWMCSANATAICGLHYEIF